MIETFIAARVHTVCIIHSICSLMPSSILCLCVNFTIICVCWISGMEKYHKLRQTTPPLHNQAVGLSGCPVGKTLQYFM